MARNFLQRSRHGTTFYFRRRVPNDVQHIFKQRQLYKSLCTSDRREAIIRARALAVQSDHFFGRLRVMTKRDSGELTVEMILSLDVGEPGKPQLRLQTEPHDSPEDKDKAIAAFSEAARTVIIGRQNPAAPAPAAPAPAGRSLGEAVADFLGSIVKSKTFRVYRTALHRQFLPYFGPDTPISDIDQEKFAKYVKHLFSDESRAHIRKACRASRFHCSAAWRDWSIPTRP